MFTIENTSANMDATGIAFSDDLSGLGGVTATGLPMNDICGTGSSLIGSSNNIMLSGGTLLAGESCSFSVTLQVDENAITGVYRNVTGSFQGTMNAAPIAFENARDSLTISATEEVPIIVTVNKSYTVPHPHPGVPGRRHCGKRWCRCGDGGWGSDLYRVKLPTGGYRLQRNRDRARRLRVGLE